MLGAIFSSMVLINEKKAFSRRLAEAMKKAGVDSTSPTWIAREFNLRYSGDPVSSQAVRKWLAGIAIPSQEKIRVLAAWLGVSAQWLRFGEPESSEPGPAPVLNQEVPNYQAEAQTLARNFRRLNEHHRKIVLEIVYAFIKSEGKR